MDSAGLYRLFRRALRSCQLYPPGSAVRREAAATLHEAVAAAAHARQEGLSFVFLEDGVFVDGRPMRDDGDGSEAGADIAARIFALGVREVRFFDGLTSSEILRLLDPLARGMSGQLNPVDEDLSVLLWEADLTHVGYLLYEDQEREAQPHPEDAVEFAAAPSLNEYLSGDLELGGELPGGVDLRLGEEERLRILAGYRREEEEDIPFKYGRLLLEVLRGEEDEAECARLAGLMLEYLEAGLSAGRIGLLRRLHERIEPDVAASIPAGRALMRLMDWYRSPALLVRVLESGAARETDAEAARCWLRGADAEVLPDLLAETTARPEALHADLVAVVRRRLEEDVDAQSLCLADSRAPVRLAALEVIIPNEDDLRRVRELLREPDARTRRLAVRALSRAEGTTAMAGLVGALTDAEAAVRMEAAGALGRRGGREALEPLLRTMASRAFEERTEEERRCIYVAAGRTAPREVWTVLARLAERATPRWFAAKRAGPNPALDALAVLGEPIPSLLCARWRRRSDLLARYKAARSASPEMIDARGEGTEEKAA